MVAALVTQPRDRSSGANRGRQPTIAPQRFRSSLSSSRCQTHRRTWRRLPSRALTTVGSHTATGQSRGEPRDGSFAAEGATQDLAARRLLAAEPSREVRANHVTPLAAEESRRRRQDRPPIAAGPGDGRSCRIRRRRRRPSTRPTRPGSVAPRRLMQQSGRCRRGCCSCACYSAFVANGGGGIRSAPPECCIVGADGQPSPCWSARLLAF